MRAFVLKRGVVRIEMNHVERPLHIDEHALLQIGRVHLDIAGRDIEILTETLHELYHARGLLTVALHAVIVAVLHAAEKDHRQKKQDDEVAVARGKTAAQIFDAHNKECGEREKRDHIPYGVVELAVLGDIGIRIELQTDTSSINVFVDYYDEEDASIILSLESNLHQQFFS